MHIILTNAVEQFKGEKIAVNSNAVLSAYSGPQEDAEEIVTFLHCPPHGTWEVTEDLETVVKLLNQSA